MIKVFGSLEECMVELSEVLQQPNVKQEDKPKFIVEMEYTMGDPTTPEGKVLSLLLMSTEGTVLFAPTLGITQFLPPLLGAFGAFKEATRIFAYNTTEEMAEIFRTYGDAPAEENPNVKMLNDLFNLDSPTEGE